MKAMDIITMLTLKKMQASLLPSESSYTLVSLVTSEIAFVT